MKPAQHTINKLRELHALQLAAISSASLGNLESSREQRIGRDHPYWTVAYEDVCRAVDREIENRNLIQPASHVDPEVVRRMAEEIVTGSWGYHQQHESKMIESVESIINKFLKGGRGE